MSLFVLDLGYTGELARIDELMGEHRAWLGKFYDHGTFLASGRKEPRTGGIILAAAESRAQVEELVATDPFARAGLVAYTITEFLPTMTGPELQRHKVTL